MSWLYLTGKPWPKKIEPDGFFRVNRTYWTYMPSNNPEFQIYLTTAPNVIHRFMQELCFGVKWKML